MSLTSQVSAKGVRVVDGDTIYLRGERIRLYGIDAPETGQKCRDGNKIYYDCGEEATKALKKLIAKNKVSCDDLGRDQYGRVLAICYVNGVNINQWMVENGWAVVYDRYSDNYKKEEKNAKSAKRGIWQGKFMKPELYRVLNKD